MEMKIIIAKIEAEMKKLNVLKWGGLDNLHCKILKEHVPEIKCLVLRTFN